MARLYAVGVGPGDPELLTRKAERILRSVDVILAPVSNPGDASVALETVRGLLDESRQEIIVHQFPMTADKSRLIPAWQEAASRMAEKVAAGRNVAIITIGDPMLYSTCIYVLRILGEQYPQIPVEIIPGISSINTAAAVAGIPLAEADERIAIIPATGGMDKIAEALAKFETVVLLKVRPVYREIIELLHQTGRKNAVVLVERVGGARQKILTDFTELSGYMPDYLSLMIIRGHHVHGQAD